MEREIRQYGVVYKRRQRDTGDGCKKLVSGEMRLVQGHNRSAFNDCRDIKADTFFSLSLSPPTAALDVNSGLSEVHLAHPLQSSLSVMKLFSVLLRVLTTSSTPLKPSVNQAGRLSNSLEAGHFTLNHHGCYTRLLATKTALASQYWPVPFINTSTGELMQFKE